MYVMTGIGDFLDCKINTLRLYADDGVQWVKIANNLNVADKIHEDFSNNQLVVNQNYAAAPFLKGGKHLIRIFDVQRNSVSNAKYADVEVKEAQGEEFHTSSVLTPENLLLFISSGYENSNLVNAYQINDISSLNIRPYNAK